MEKGLKNYNYVLRDNVDYYNNIIIKNHFGEKSFNHFFIKLITLVGEYEFTLDFNFFKLRIRNNIDILYDKFVLEFPN